MLCDIREREPQLDLFTESAQYRNSENLMQLLDTLNKQGRHNLFFAGQGINPVFAMKRNMLSPAYLTSWDDLPKVRLG